MTRLFRGLLLLGLLSTALVACKSNEATDEQPQNGPTFTVVNNSSMPIYSMYASPTGEMTWGDNLLEHELNPGEYATILLDPGEWDIRIEDSEGNAREFHQVPFGEDSSELTIQDEAAEGDEGETEDAGETEADNAEADAADEVDEADGTNTEE